MTKAERTRRLRELRKEHDLTADDIADLLGRSKSIVDHWMSGRHYVIPAIALTLLEYKLDERSPHERAE